jgi:hypothetical protein
VIRLRPALPSADRQQRLQPSPLLIGQIVPLQPVLSHVLRHEGQSNELRPISLRDTP